jgi:TatD DNase family protein
LSVPLFDTHCHLHDEKLRATASELLTRAVQSGLAGATIICADPANLQAFPDFPEHLKAGLPTHFRLAYTIGLHPHEAQFLTAEMESDIRKKALKACAIGETGLDYFYDLSDRELQKKAFNFQIELASELQKPLVIHCREARQDILSMLDRDSIHRHPNPGILHCFTEDWPTARRLLDLNFYISFSGILTFKNAEPLREVAKQVPLEKLLIETDSPYLAPPPHRGKLNEPAFVERVLAILSEIRKESLEDLREKLWQNSLKVYGLQ